MISVRCGEYWEVGISDSVGEIFVEIISASCEELWKDPPKSIHYNRKNNKSVSYFSQISSSLQYSVLLYSFTWRNVESANTCRPYTLLPTIILLTIKANTNTQFYLFISFSIRYFYRRKCNGEKQG